MLILWTFLIIISIIVFAITLFFGLREILRILDFSIITKSDQEESNSITTKKSESPLIKEMAIDQEEAVHLILRWRMIVGGALLSFAIAFFIITIFLTKQLQEVANFSTGVLNAAPMNPIPSPPTLKDQESVPSPGETKKLPDSTSAPEHQVEK